MTKKKKNILHWKKITGRADSVGRASFRAPAKDDFLWMLKLSMEFGKKSDGEQLLNQM